MAEIINERDRTLKDGSAIKEFLVQWRGSTRQDLEWIAENDLKAEEVINMWKFRNVNSSKDKLEVINEIDEEDALREDGIEVKNGEIKSDKEELKGSDDGSVKDKENVTGSKKSKDSEKVKSGKDENSEESGVKPRVELGRREVRK